MSFLRNKECTEGLKLKRTVHHCVHTLLHMLLTYESPIRVQRFHIIHTHVETYALKYQLQISLTQDSFNKTVSKTIEPVLNILEELKFNNKTKGVLLQAIAFSLCFFLCLSPSQALMTISTLL